MEKIFTENAPAAIGPYSQAVVCGSLVCLSGQIALDPKTGAVVSDTIEGQTERICRNIGGILKAAGTSFDEVVKTTCFLADMSDFAAFNDVYGKHFTSSPARSCVAVKSLPKGVLAEVDVIAWKGASNET